MGKTFCLIASPPRSASSAVSSIVEGLGFDLGVHPAGRPDSWNERGYFENKALLVFNAAALGGKENFWEPQDRGVDLKRVDRLSVLLEEEFIGDRSVIKDPRIYQLGKVYCDAFLRMDDVKIRFVHLWRSKEAVSNSLKIFAGKWYEIHGQEFLDNIFDGYHRLIEETIQLFRDRGLDVEVLQFPIQSLATLPDYAVETLARFLEVHDFDNAALCWDKELLHHGA